MARGRYRRPDGVREALEESDAAPSDDDEGSGWSKWDKLAGLGTLGRCRLLPTSVRDVIAGGVIDIVLGPLAEMLPFYAVVMVLALATGLYSTLLQANLMDMEKMGKYQERMKDIQQRQKDAKERGDGRARKLRRGADGTDDRPVGMSSSSDRVFGSIVVNIPLFLWLSGRSSAPASTRAR